MAEFATNGKGNLGVTLGAIGTGLSALNGTGVLSGLFGGNSSNYASKDDLANAITLAQKDSEIAMLKAEAASEVKMQDIYERVMTKVNSNYAEQSAINTQQAVYNSTLNATASVLQNQVAQLFGLTKLTIPNGNIMPGWGSVTVMPTATGTTTA